MYADSPMHSKHTEWHTEWHTECLINETQKRSEPALRMLFQRFRSVEDDEALRPQRLKKLHLW